MKWIGCTRRGLTRSHTHRPASYFGRRTPSHALTPAVTDQQDRLQRFYGVGLLAYQGKRLEWEQEVRGVVQSDGGNAYYRWFLGLGL